MAKLTSKKSNFVMQLKNRMKFSKIMFRFLKFSTAYAGKVRKENSCFVY